MPVLIDGFNLLHAARSSVRASSDLSRSGLAKLLGRWSEITNERVTVVFDGSPPAGGLAEQLSDPRITTIHSGADRTADERIAERLHEDAAARQILVVSSDRAVQRSARGRRAAFVSSEEFFARLCRDLAAHASPAPAEPDEKRRGLKPEETDAWLARFGVEPDPPETFEHP